MDCEILVKTNKCEYKVFLKKGFFSGGFPTDKLHTHLYTEMHLVMGGRAIFYVAGKNVEVKDGDLLIIPGGNYHCCIEKESSLMHTAFQISFNIEKALTERISPGIVSSFFSEIKNCHITRNYSMISSYISLIMAYCENTVCPVKPTNDYKYLIFEFFSQRYGENIRLCDLAQVLCVSQRQAERLVIKHTGKTFQEKLTSQRIWVAKGLIESSDMSLNEIAEYVGYRSYAGFWKAMKKYQSNRI